MPVQLNGAGRAQAGGLIRQGKVDRTSSWSFTAADGNALLGDPPNWGRYSKWFLGKEPGADPKSKAAWKYPYGKNGKVYRRAVIAIKSRAAQQNATAIASAADRLLQAIDRNQEDAFMPDQIRLLPRDEWVEAINNNEDDIGLLKFGKAVIKQGTLDPKTGMYDVEAVISTENIDRDRDIIYQDGWQLSHYRENPVVLWAHLHREPPIARAVKVEVDDRNQLVAVDRFTPRDINPFGFMIYNMVQQEFMNATSVGFRVLKYEIDNERRGYDIIEQELYEHSFVPVPANPDALVQANAAGIDLQPLREWATQILDGDKENMFIWLPRSTVESIWKQVGFVSGDQKSWSATGQIFKTFDRESDPDSVEGELDLDQILDDETEKLFSDEELLVGDDGEINLNQELEDTMELKDLLEKIDELVSAVKENTEACKEVVSLLKEVAEEDELTEEQVSEIAEKAISGAIAEQSGALPD
jgi:HK97 family phage prohead protease